MGKMVFTVLVVVAVVVVVVVVVGRIRKKLIELVLPAVAVLQANVVEALVRVEQVVAEALESLLCLVSLAWRVHDFSQIWGETEVWEVMAEREEMEGRIFLAGCGQYSSVMNFFRKSGVVREGVAVMAV